MLERFDDLQTLSRIKDTTWKRNYAPSWSVRELLTSASAPVDARGWSVRWRALGR